MENTVDNELGIVLDDAVQTPAEVTEQPKEPGWIKQRVNAAVAKAEARIRAEYDTMLAPLRESVMDREAKELVDSGEFKSLERAQEYVKLKSGVTSEPVASQKREESEDPVSLARADLLAKQAEKIQQSTGIDVMAAFSSDPQVRQNVLSGDWDFHDVATYLSGEPKRVPAPMRSPNGARVGAVSIKDMTNEQFQKLQESLASGRTYDMRK